MPCVYNEKNKELGFFQKSQFISFLQLARQFDEPFYVYNLDGILERLELYSQAFSKNHQLHYAMKANHHPEILKAFARRGVGVDIVSGGEMDRAFEAGFPPEKIIFSGVGKSRKELQKALEKNIFQINVESLQELMRISEISKSLKTKARVALRINPNVNPDTHPYITTGFRDNKFGLDLSVLPQVIQLLKSELSSLDFQGLSLHIGSQIKEISSMLEALEKTKVVMEELRREGFPIKTLDIGGGIGISYEGDGIAEEQEDIIRIQSYGREVQKILKDFDGLLLTEPGRCLVGSFGFLIGEIQYIKETPYKTFAILNTGMHHLMRPSLYSAHHRIWPIKKNETLNAPTKTLYDIVGPICESSDTLGRERLLLELKAGDYLAILDAGAYGAVMSSGYNSHKPVREIVVSGGEYPL